MGLNPSLETESFLDRRVAASFSSPAGYSTTAPYHPAEPYPDYQFPAHLGDRPNSAYAGVRQCFRLLGLDQANFGTSNWNPLGSFIAPGQTVLLKPNFIKESRSDRAGEWLQIITHGSVIRAVVDYAWLALGGKGRIIVADGPQTDSDFDLIWNSAQSFVSWL